ncbi:MAG: M20/M25/M40 family metallo-hydrolase, partial [Gemmatimonadales bacterium]|nr:M20/M25/M40 family metallo-hydrolase [Gemmatimonadales bacterium]
MHTTLSDRDLLSRLVAYDTTSRLSNLPLADFVAEYLDRPGTRLTRLPSEDGRKTSLLIETGPPARDGAGLVLSGHMDVVPADEAGWRSDPFALDDQGDRYAARGSADMKGFLALAINRFAPLDGSRLTAPLALLLTYDEEVGTVGARRFVETFDAERPLPRSVVVGEPTALRVIRSHKGMLRLRLSFEGRAAHSGYPHLGRSAIEPAARAIVALAELRHQMESERPAYAELFPAVPYPALNTGIVQGGSAANVIPDRCDIQLGIRLLPEMSAQAMADRVETAVRDSVGR